MDPHDGHTRAYFSILGILLSFKTCMFIARRIAAVVPVAKGSSDAPHALEKCLFYMPAADNAHHNSSPASSAATTMYEQDRQMNSSEEVYMRTDVHLGQLAAREKESGSVCSLSITSTPCNASVIRD